MIPRAISPITLAEVSCPYPLAVVAWTSFLAKWDFLNFMVVV